MKFRLETVKNVMQIVKELAVGLKSLNFSDNFQSFEWSGIVAANTEEKIRNGLTVKPSKYIIVHQTGNALVTAGDTVWDENYVYIKNHSGVNSATLTIVFLR